jgi:3-hydroxyacyl-[acyl-carrier-protein] dehydratase
MRFLLIDRILDLQPGRNLVAVKNLSMAEEYLADHFPGFPVMPGVLMLEALTQAGAWLVRDMEDFAHSVVVLKRAKMVKYGSFVEPGRQLQLKVEMLDEPSERECTLRGEGSIDGQTMVKINKFTLTRYNLRERDPALHSTDTRMVAWLREIYATLRNGSVGSRATFQKVPGIGRSTVLAQGGQDV